MQAQHFKHYEIKASLGEGGFGQVFEAWDKKLCRSVALKRLKNLGAGGAANNLIHEARMGAALEHAAFVKVHAIEDDEDSQTIVMELVRGQTLKQILQTALPPVELALDIVQQIAQAMQVAHASGLVHGDLKPSNLILDPNGKVRILDFGLASQADPQATTSLQQADPQGTISYMAPERLMGAAVSVQTDVYALGVILYELLTGHRPFAELNGLALAAAHMQSSSEQWPFPAELPAPLRALVVAMCARECGKRVADMQAVSQCIEGIVATTDSEHSSSLPISKQLVTLMPLTDSTTVSSTLGHLRQHWRRWAGASLFLAIIMFGAYWSVQRLTPIPVFYSEAREMELGLHALRFYDRANSLPKAAEHFENILAHNPKNAAAMAGLALTYSFRYAGDEKDELWLKKAHASVQAALNINPQLALAHAAHARILNQQLNDVPALIAAERALALAPMDVFALTAKFNILYSSRRFEEAKNFASAALQRHPQERIFADSLGSALYNLGNFEEAERAFRRSLEIEPDAVFAYSNLSSVLMAKGRSEEALQVLQQGLQVRPNSVLYTNLGHALFLKADYVNAALAFEQAISPTKGNPADYKAWANLGDTLLWLPGRREQAQLTYQKAAELLQPLLAKSPQDATMVSRMGLYLQRAGNSAEATTLSIRALALAPADANVHFRAALVFELQGNRTRAISAIQHARRLGYPKSYIEGEPDFLALRRDPHYIP